MDPLRNLSEDAQNDLDVAFSALSIASMTLRREGVDSPIVRDMEVTADLLADILEHYEQGQP